MPACDGFLLVHARKFRLAHSNLRQQVSSQIERDSLAGRRFWSDSRPFGLGSLVDRSPELLGGHLQLSPKDVLEQIRVLDALAAVGHLRDQHRAVRKHFPVERVVARLLATSGLVDLPLTYLAEPMEIVCARKPQRAG